MRRVFISHSTADQELVDALVELLQMGAGVPAGAIFCTSTPGHGVEPGARFSDTIRAALQDTSCVIALLSPAFLRSRFCTLELGGLWALQQRVVPLIVPPLSYDDMRDVLEGVQALPLDREASIHHFLDVISKVTGYSPLSVATWHVHARKFEARLNAFVKAADNERILENSADAGFRNWLLNSRANPHKGDLVLDQEWAARRPPMNDTTIVITTGCGTWPELFDRPTAYKLKRLVDQLGEARARIPAHAVVLGDRWYIGHREDYSSLPLICIGGPKANALTAELQHEGQLIAKTDEWEIFRKDRQWGLSGLMQHPSAFAAVAHFAVNYLDHFIEEVW